MIDHIDDHSEYHERLIRHIAETELNGLKVVEIRMRPEKISLLISNSPKQYIVPNGNGEISFWGVPLTRKEISNDIEWELQTEARLQVNPQ